MARDRPESVQHQRIPPPPPGGPSCPQPLRGSGCHGERGHWARLHPRGDNGGKRNLRTWDASAGETQAGNGGPRQAHSNKGLAERPCFGIWSLRRGLFPELGEKGAGLLDTRTAVLPRAAEGGVGSGKGAHVLSSGLGDAALSDLGSRGGPLAIGVTLRTLWFSTPYSL